MNAHVYGTALMDELVKYLKKVTQPAHMPVSVKKTSRKSNSWQ